MKFHDFLNPKSMMTPGIAGMVIMGISNTLWVTFSVPKVGSSLILSFLLALLVLKKVKVAAIYEKAIYLIFNTLIIFSLAVNTNFAGRKVSGVVNATESSQGTSGGYDSKVPSVSLFASKQIVGNEMPIIVSRHENFSSNFISRQNSGVASYDAMESSQEASVCYDWKVPLVSLFTNKQFVSNIRLSISNCHEDFPSANPINNMEIPVLKKNKKFFDPYF